MKRKPTKSDTGRIPRSDRQLYEMIWEMVEQVPRGKVATYGQIADFCGIPGQARLIGYALHNLPRGTDVPWHRVINAQGKISLGDLDGMYEVQKLLLKKEGVRFVKDIVDFRKYGWLKRPVRMRRRR
jgi:methylated-DNA-protein-cysteine methyltransferase-like protein